MRESLWDVEPAQALSELGTTPNGLTKEEVERRLKEFGPNEIETVRRATSFRLFLSQFENPLVYILLIATFIAALAGETTDALIIICIVSANATLGFLLERKSEKALENLRKYVRYSAKVIRNGQRAVVDSRELVPGDVVELTVGDIVPADLRLIECENFTTNESTLTGESLPVEKTAGLIKAKPIPQELSNFAFLGTSVLSGLAKGVVVSTGRRTFFGRSAKYLYEEFGETEFAKNVKRFSGFLLQVVAVMTTFVLIANISLQRPLIDSLLFALALAVGITPEAMPFVITVSLSLGSLKMAKRKVVVKRLEAIEDIGNMDVLCTDKTGTLTENVITIESFFDVENRPSESVVEVAAAACDVSIKRGKAVGMPLDAAICNYVMRKMGVGRLTAYRRLQLIPFDFNRRRMSVVAEKDGNHVLICKGAPESVISVCKDVRIAGVAEPISEVIENLKETYTTWSRSGYRVIAVAMKEIQKADVKLGRKFSQDDERDLTFIGFITFLDPPRKDAMRALAAFRKLKVDLKILSGDEPNVTAEVCKSVGIDVKGGKVVTGSDLEGMAESELREVVERYNVFARVTPEQKVEIVKALRDNGHTVGFLGDGVNDAPALRVADVGISVDTAVDVAKEAADIILLRKSLSVIAGGVMEGRRIFGNTIKYVLNTISANFGNMLTVAFASTFLPFIPLLPTQVLLLNLLSDLPLITISTDNVDPEYLKSPGRWSIRFISEAMVFFGLISTLFDLLTMQALHSLLSKNPQVELLFRTGWFLESGLSEMFVTFSIRTHRPFYRSRPSWLLVTMSEIGLIIALVLVYTPLGEFFKLVPLPLHLLFTVFVILLSYFALLELLKRTFFKRHGFGGIAPDVLKELKVLRARIGATRRKIRRLERTREAGEISEEAYLELTSKLEEELRSLRDKVEELLRS